jgi:hypothetical protein
MQQPAAHARSIATAAAAVLALALAAPAPADTYPLLEEINRQTQSLYQDVQAGIVRVQLPVPQWVREAAARDDPVGRWENIVDPKLRQNLEQHREEMLRSGRRMDVSITRSGGPQATSRPADAVEHSWKITPTDSREILLESRGDSGGGASIVIHAGPETGAPLVPNLRLRPPPGTFAPNNIGLLLDDAGHMLIPLYIERETIGDAPIRIMIADTEASARFVGSDDKTNLSILKLDRPLGRPVRMAGAGPGEGAMVMMLNPNSGAGLLALWTGGQRDYGVVVFMDGSVAGIVRFGQFLGGPACGPVIEQLIKVGRVERAVLGVRLTELHPDDPIRQRNHSLSDRPALVVDEVTAGSLAESAGLKQGDFILALDNHPVGDLATWAGLCARPARSKLTVLRQGNTIEIPVNLEPQPIQPK